MKNTGKPVQDYEKLKELIRSADQGPLPEDFSLDFSNTEIAFADKSDEELRRTYRLFRLMNQPWLVRLGAPLALWAVRLRLPFAEKIIRETVFRQFCGGTTLLECQQVIDRLAQHRVLSILDYGAEAKESEEDFNIVMNENIRAIEFAVHNPTVPVVSTKLTGLIRFGLLEKISAGRELSPDEKQEHRAALKRVDAICSAAARNDVRVFIDAEESWIQDAIDGIVNRMMRRYNKERVIVYNTFQLYRTDRLQYLLDCYETACKEGFRLGAKLVRGAYMEKERERAREMGYPDPIHPDKKSTDAAYNAAIHFCVEHYEDLASCNASHNAESCMLQAELIARKGLPRNHPHLNFSQLLGMSDNLTFNLADSGYNVAKYVPYGPVREVIPYLIRRAEENTAVTGDMSRELSLVTREMKRRGLVR